MTITSDLHPPVGVVPRRSPSPLPEAMLSNPDLTKLYMSASCPELKAESVISSDEEEAAAAAAEEEEEEVLLDNSNERLLFEPLLETHDENAFSMDDHHHQSHEDENYDHHHHPHHERSIKWGPLPTVVAKEGPAIVVESDNATTDMSNRRKLQWEFKGLTIWLELEEFDNDLSRAIEDFSSRHSSPFIPQSHTTAIYGMEHLSVEEAKRRLREVPSKIGVWPAFGKPTGVTSDIAVCGRPGQVCSIAWSELTLASNPEHELAMDKLYQLFYDEDIDHNVLTEFPVRDRPWKPHNSIAYDNPETNALSLLDTVIYASRNPSLLGRGRRVEAISLWSTVGKMEDWTLIDRVKFW